jgi:hypothetical protein
MANILEILESKFTSGNSVPVERTVLLRKEYDALLEYIRSLEESSNSTKNCL